MLNLTTFLNPASYHQKVRATAVKTGAVVGFSTENQSRSSSPSEVKLWNAKLMTKEQWGLACKGEEARPGSQAASGSVRARKRLLLRLQSVLYCLAPKMVKKWLLIRQCSFVECVPGMATLLRGALRFIKSGAIVRQQALLPEVEAHHSLHPSHHEAVWNMGPEQSSQSRRRHFI